MKWRAFSVTTAAAAAATVAGLPSRPFAIIINRSVDCLPQSRSGSSSSSGWVMAPPVWQKERKRLLVWMRWPGRAGWRPRRPLHLPTTTVAVAAVVLETGLLLQRSALKIAPKRRRLCELLARLVGCSSSSDRRSCRCWGEEWMWAGEREGEWVSWGERESGKNEWEREEQPLNSLEVCCCCCLPCPSIRLCSSVHRAWTPNKLEQQAAAVARLRLCHHHHHFALLLSTYSLSCWSELCRCIL